MLYELNDVQLHMSITIDSRVTGIGNCLRASWYRKRVFTLFIGNFNKVK